ncbi:amino acid adenylation domain-containing protein [Pseudomonas sp. S44]|uniref:non-ribosomal peptide synthetase n=1 Tax=Pseudomonas sp. S44 TaxID=2767450 RepID=UPI00190D9024|nr:non-ribosomal peptide synthetase [Pseudomonas sp. S44]MBK0060073.1 amino acid adenylation domain-containing protein [Pseudomonas sp. S44]
MAVMDNIALVQRFIRLPLSQRRAFLEKLAGKGLTLGQLPIPAAREGLDVIPLSYAQQRQWFLWQLEPHSSAYHIPSALRLKGTLDVPALARSFQWLLGRHESLRTRFVETAEGVRQVIEAPASAFELPLQHLPADAGADTEQAVRDFVEARTQALFDLQQGPLLRVDLLRLADDDHVLVMTQHHIVSDGWSMQVLVEELVHAYAAFSGGGEPTLAAASIQYADYAIWQQAWMEAGESERQLGYWAARLGGEQPVLELPFDHSRPQQPSHRGERLAVTLPGELQRGLRSLAQSQGMTPFMLLLASFQLLLHRYSGQREIRVGVPVANRQHPDTKALIGFFINTQVLDVSIDPQNTFRELLQQVRTAVLGAQAHQALPFEQLVEALAPERSAGVNPLFQVMHNHLGGDGASALNLPGLHIEGLDVRTVTAQFDLTLDTAEAGEQLSAAFTYATDLFERATVERMARHWLQLLGQMVAAPDTSLVQVPLLTAQERADIIAEWNPRPAEYPVQQCIHQRIEEQARLRPEAIAVTLDDRQLSYGQLEAQANHLAHRLLAQGVGPEVRVGLVAERSLEMIVAILATLKAGAAYVPMDPSAPAQRLAYMMADSGIALLLVQPHLAARVQGAQDVRQLMLEPLSPQPLADPGAPQLACDPRQLAYVIYTSGSTGQPKGVLLPHDNVMRLFAATERWFDFGVDDVWTLFHSYAFDFSVWEIFGALMHGGRLVIVPHETCRSTEDFHALLHREGVTVLNQTPSAFKQLMQVACTRDAAELGALRQVIFGGEALEVQALRPWYGHFAAQGPRLVNMYGITETTVHVTYRPLSPRDLEGAASSPIGEPIDDLSWYLLDGQLEPVAPGCIGELYVGGAGLARGYHRRSDLSAQRFVPDLFGNGGRLYRTGDLARYRNDGVIEYVGRIDQQVKIRGFRIELGEIEARLLQLPGVREAVVLASDGSAGTQLVAYVVAQQGSGEVSALVERLRSGLKADLPEYMLPAHILCLDSLPLTLNGKLDRAALPAPTLRQEDYQAPRTALEQQVAQIWQQVLEVERVGLQDDFFVLGGHSLLATQVVSRLRHGLGLQVALRTLFEQTTLQAFVASLTPTADAAQPALLPVPRGELAPLSYAQERQWFLWQLDPSSSAYNIPSALRLRGALNVPALQRSFDSLLARHESLRTTFAQAPQGAQQRIHAAVPLALPIETVAEAELAARVQAEVAQVFDLEQGPLLRVRLLRVAQDDHVLVVTQHHSVSDGWSMQVLVEELVQCYAAFSQGEAPTLPVLPLQYADYAIWQRQWMEAGERERQLGYWTERLAGEQFLQLPTDHPRPAEQSFRGAQLALALPDNLAQGLQQRARELRVTPFMLLLATFQVLLHRYSGQGDIRVGVPVANRNRLETERLIGFFVNTQVLRAEVEPGMAFTRLLEQVRDSALEAQAHQDLPFEQLVEALHPERSLSHSPLFQVMFNHQGERAAEASMAQVPGLQVEALAWDSHTAQFDLTLNTFESGTAWSAIWTYATDLFLPETIERLSQHWLNLLQAVVAAPEQRVGELAMLEGSERERIERQWNANGLDFDRSQCIHRLIEAQVCRTPQALAAIWGDEQLDYATLNAHANRLARHLVSLGVGPEVRVGVALPRSMSMLVALLAVLKAGGAYVPLDPDYPAERVSYMLDDSAARVLISERAVLDALAVDGAFASVLLDELTLDGDDSDLPARAVADNLAYVIYTSGSTGRPKGVAIAHRNVAALVAWSQQVYSQADIQGVLASTSICFDLSVWELFVTLAGGGFIVGARNALELPELAARDRVRLINSVPSAASALLRAGQIPASVRIVNLAGEPLKQSVVEALYALEHIQHVYDLYGPSEDTTYSTWTRREAGGQANIGRPLHNTASYLLDGELQSVPVGATAELYLAGEGITRGYLLRPGLTAEKYLPDPFASDGSRLYRTGDLARYREDGVLEYAGRVDHQVKVRGLRIELGEIEARLQAHADVREVAVIAHQGELSTQLVGYVVASALHDNAEPLKAWLKQTLPDYMVPTHWLFLERLPLTPNGKLDRKALPAPQATAPARQVAPRSVLEKRLVAIWEEVLKVSPIGVTDNFFELGGDSIISIQVVSRARQVGIRFTPKALFQHQTVQGLATVAQEGEGAQLIEQGPLTGEMPLLPIQQAFFDTDIPERHHWNQSVLLKPAQPLHAGYLEQALQALVAHHDALRLSFTESDAGWQAHYRPLGEQPTELLWQRTLNTADELEALAESAQRSLSLGDGPLLRAVLADLPDGSQRLLLVIHHLAVDGVSWRILFEDLQLALEQLSSGKPLALPGKTSSQRDWAGELQRAAQSPRLQQSLDFWRATLEGAHDSLPCQRPDTANRNCDGVTVHSTLDAEQTRQLLQQAPAAYRTRINDLLLTALARVICRWTGHDHALVQLEGHGREDLFEHLDLTRSVGWFTSVFPVRLTPAAGLGDSLKQIKEQLRAIPDNGLGFGVLRHLGDASVRDALRALPTPRITFNYLGQLDASFADESPAWLPAGENRGAEHSPEAPLDNWLNLNGQVFDGRLQISWTFSRERFDIATLQRLAEDYQRELVAVVGHCCTVGVAGVTPSDFPLAGLDQAQLDALPVAAQTIQDLYPLSPMQQGMLFHSLYEQASGDYINQMRVDIDGLDPQRFHAAWQATVQAHDILRTAFVWEGDLAQPLQVVHQQVEVPFSVHDLRDLDAPAPALQALADAQRQQGFELASAPLLRLLLVDLGQGRHHFIYTYHHILMDGWSHAQVLSEVLQHYNGQAQEAPRGRYRDYIAWLARQDQQGNQDFWRAQLAELDEPTLLAQVFRGVTPASDEQAHAQHDQVFDAPRSARLAAFAREQKVTLNTVLQAAWALLLQRHQGQQTVCFGATVAGRPSELAGVEQQVGLFINTLPVALTLHAQHSVASLLQGLQAQNLSLREHEYTPLFDIQRWAGQGGEALFDSLLVFENYPVSDVLQARAPDGLRFGAIDNLEQTNYPLTLLVNAGEQLSLQYSFDPQCFTPVQIAGLAAQLAQILDALVEDAERPLGEVDSLPADLRRQVLHDWSGQVGHDVSWLPVHRQFEAMAQAQPQAIAAVYGTESISYAELNLRANRLAHGLIARGVGPDRLVGLCLDRGLEMLVALLAVLKAGGAYVPLDPDFPEERLDYMIQDSGIGLLLTQPHLAERRTLPQGVQQMLLAAESDALDALAAHDPQVAVADDHLAYVIYTSGSTGRPKGVMVPHRGLGNFLDSMAAAPGLQAQDRVLSLTTFSFDIFGLEIFLPLVRGARVVLVDRQAARDPEQLLEVVREQAVNVVQATPSTWRMLLDNPQAELLRGCRMLCGGEALAPELSLRMLALGGEVWNLYGPTETTIWSARRRLDATQPAPLLGEAIGNTTLFVVGPDLQPVAPGVAGELLIGGEGLARGYHGRAALSAERFVPHPFADDGSRLYRTGDLVRHLADGTLEYLARLDHQVKIRGFRIELGEIQALMQDHPQVREAVVIARDGAGGAQLVGYVVPLEAAEAGSDGLREALRQSLAERLPAYMVPAHIQVLERMPLTPNGKLDRKALPAVDASASRQVYQAPRTDLERQVAEVWQQVLQLEQVGVHDHFFELGGHSLLAVSVVSRLQLALGLKLSPQLVFQAPVLEQFAEALGQAGGQVVDESKLSKLEWLLDEMEEV